MMKIIPRPGDYVCLMPSSATVYASTHEKKSILWLDIRTDDGYRWTDTKD